jgi:hypothetical protein
VKPTTWTMEIPGWAPAALNQLQGHWGTKCRLKKLDADTIATAAMAYGVPPATGKRRVSLTIIYPPKQRRHDKDAFWKSMLDALTRCGALKDDGPKWVEFGQPVYARGDELRSFITLEDLS